MPILITNGTVIYNTGGTSVSLKASDGPQTLPEETEARLVAAGVAMYVGKLAHAVATLPDNVNDDPEGDNLPDDASGSDGAQDRPEYSTNMKSAELRGLMEEFGLTYKVGMTKANMVAALDAYFEDEVRDDEEPPNLGAEEPVI